jgi:hypothetical protein
MGRLQIPGDGACAAAILVTPMIIRRIICLFLAVLHENIGFSLENVDWPSRR